MDNSGGAAAEMKQTIWLLVEFKTSPSFMLNAESILKKFEIFHRTFLSLF